MKDGFFGPLRPGREGIKSRLFRQLQECGFRLFYRYRVCVQAEEPVAAEKALLQAMDYAGNERDNRGYRQLELPGGRTLASYARRQHL